MRLGPYAVSPLLVIAVALLVIGGGVAAYLLSAGGHSSAPASSGRLTSAGTATTSSSTTSSAGGSATVTVPAGTVPGGTVPGGTTPAGTRSRLNGGPAAGPPKGTIVVRAQAHLRICSGGHCQVGPAPLMLVELRSLSSGQATFVETDRTGHFTAFVAPGRYRLRVIGDQQRVVARGSAVVSAQGAQVQLTPTG